MSGGVGSCRVVHVETQYPGRLMLVSPLSLLLSPHHIAVLDFPFALTAVVARVMGVPCHSSLPSSDVRGLSVCLSLSHSLHWLSLSISLISSSFLLQPAIMSAFPFLSTSFVLKVLLSLTIMLDPLWGGD